MNVFVIKLKDSTGLRKNARAQLERAGVPFEFIEAIPGEPALQENFSSYDATQFVLNVGRKVTPGEIGCFAGHRAL